MRILFITNFFPPYELGGQGRSCAQVVEGLQQRGHTTLVLTSMQGTDNVVVEEDGVSRSLYLEMDDAPLRHSLTFFTKRKARESANLRRLAQVLDDFAPDVISIWGMWNLPRSLAALAEERCPGKVVYRFASYWPTLPSQHELYWRQPGRTWYSRLLKWGLARVALAILDREELPSLQFKHAFSVSAATRDRLVEMGIPVAHARVIHTGLDVEQFLNGRLPAERQGERLELLYAGRLSADKGVETAISAMERLVYTHNCTRIRLKVAGSGAEDYEKRLHRQVAERGLTSHVTFLGQVPSEQMAQLYQESEVLLVPSLWAEPFARVLLEGMSAALVIVAASTGGSGEIIDHGRNGLLFAPGDDQELAEKILRLAQDPELRLRLARAGRQTALEQFTFERMMDEIQDYLLEVAQATQ